MDETTLNVVELDLNDLNTQEINASIRTTLRHRPNFLLRNALGQHNIGVGVTNQSSFVVQGDLGHYAFAMCEGIQVRIEGDVGWGVGENLMSGEIFVNGDAGSSAGPSLRGGVVAIAGNAGPRAGIGMKGGTLIIGGDAGYMSGFMMQKGTIIILGNAGPGLGDSMYDGQIFVAGTITELGHDTRINFLNESEYEAIAHLVLPYHMSIPLPSTFRKVVSAGTLHHFDKKEIARWKTAL